MENARRESPVGVDRDIPAEMLVLARLAPRERGDRVFTDGERGGSDDQEREQADRGVKQA